MLTLLEARGEEIARRARATAIERIASGAREGLPGVSIAAETDGVVLSGRGLKRRLLVDPRLQWIAGWLR